LPEWLHTPAEEHVSMPLQKSPSSQDAPVFGGWKQAPSPSHWSFVHELLSPVQPVPAATAQLPLPPVVSLQWLLHSPPPAQGLPAWVHAPPLQTSAPSQKCPLSHGAALLGCVQAPAPSHLSSVQGLSSLAQAVSAVTWQFPLPPPVS
jgi:hypothetical protein